MAEFQKIASLSDVPPGTCRSVLAGETSVALCNVGGTVYALTNTCPHRGGPLGNGVLRDGHVICPWHGWAFDVTTGKLASKPDSAVAVTYPVRQEGDDILVEL